MNHCNTDIKILIVDDEESIVESIERLLIKKKYIIDKAYNGEDALNKFENTMYDIVILDIIMPKIDGIELLKRIKLISPKTEVVILTGYGTISSAVTAMKHRAYNYITKPFDNSILLNHIKNIAEKKLLLKEIQHLKNNQTTPGPYSPDLIGFSRSMQKVYSMIEKVITSDCNIIITGATGTGKEMVAKVIHKYSIRNNGPFIPVNCKALPNSILENELFGHEKGAFTGANKSQIGYFEAADGGILFLDEITEISPDIQVKLLRSIQDKKIYRLGKPKTIKTNIRIISATNKDIDEAVKKGYLRKDLFFRLNVVNIHMPLLKSRTADIPLLAEYFLKYYSDKAKKKINDIDPHCFEIFLKYDWPGNVRELENVIEYAVTFTNDNKIKIIDLPRNLTGGVFLNRIFCDNDYNIPFVKIRNEVMQSFYIEFITGILKKTDGNVTKAAEKMQISRSYLNSLIKKYL